MGLEKVREKNGVTLRHICYTLYFNLTKTDKLIHFMVVFTSVEQIYPGPTKGSLLQQ